MAEGDVYTADHIAANAEHFPTGTTFRQEAPMLRFYVRWDLETWGNPYDSVFDRKEYDHYERGVMAQVLAGGSAFVARTPGGTVVVEAPSLAEAQELASYESETLMDVDFLGGSAGGSRRDPAVVASVSLPFTDAELDAIGEGRCFFRVTSVVPAALDDSDSAR